MKTAGDAKPITRNPAETPLVEFTHEAPDAREVFLAGCFNEWNPTSLPMTRDAEGVWRLKIPLADGHHEYRFIADGIWSGDPHACAYVPNPWGWCHCVVEVAAAPADNIAA
ncbi:MAG: isoamylase early set domain-containing protein [Opitutae bacterium]|nr:isoamylase early set domain-containing protein [Opitutae bacterium]